MDYRTGIESNTYAAGLVRFKARQLSRRRGFCTSDREDLEQELWAAVVGRVKRFDPTKASLNTFLALIVDSAVASIVRHHMAEKRSPDRNEMSLNDPVLDADGGIVDRHQTTSEAAASRQGTHERTQDVADACGKLNDPETREVAELLKLGNTVNSIAGRLGMSRRAVARHVAQIRAAFEDAALRGYL